MRPDFGHGQSKPYAQRLEEARTWADEAGLPGPVLVDDDSYSFLRFGTGPTGGTKPPGWGYMYILNSDGLIVYQDTHDREFKQYQCRFVLDRLLDPEFDRAFRQGFPDRRRTLPTMQERDGGVAYVEDFESYADTYDYVLQPRWGFSQRTQNAVEKSGVLQENEGRGGSCAASIATAAPGALHNMEHRLPKPLAKGYVRFYVRRGRAGTNKSDPQTVVSVALYGGDGKRAGTLEAEGEWGREVFTLNGQPSTVPLSDDAWHAVEVRLRPGAEAVTVVDGKTLGTLPMARLTRIGFDCGHHGFLLDDVELFYTRKK